jgi:hypothetical protein
MQACSEMRQIIWCLWKERKKKRVFGRRESRSCHMQKLTGRLEGRCGCMTTIFLLARCTVPCGDSERTDGVNCLPQCVATLLRAVYS